MENNSSALDANVPGSLQDQGLSQHRTSEGVHQGMEGQSSFATATPGVGGRASALEDGVDFDAADISDMGGEATESAAKNALPLSEAVCDAVRKTPLASVGAHLRLGSCWQTSLVERR